MIALCFATDIAQNDIRKEKLSDGVMRWYRVQDEKPWFFRQIENITNAVINRQPFGKSVAFLVGISKYEHISPQLPFVKNDLEALREFLLNRGGFDEVYVAADHVANAGLVQDYMSNNRMKLRTDDRLLFYYSGHGTDIGGKTGYIQFSKAQPGVRDINNYLAIRECTEWSSVLKAKHILFIYDCCVSGLAFTHKSGSSDSGSEILSTLSGNGSRTVITAGTAEERSFGVGDHSVFTQAFLKAFDSCPKTGGFMTTDQIFALTVLKVKDFCREYDNCNEKFEDECECRNLRAIIAHFT